MRSDQLGQSEVTSRWRSPPATLSRLVSPTVPLRSTRISSLTVAVAVASNVHLIVHAARDVDDASQAKVASRWSNESLDQLAAPAPPDSFVPVASMTTRSSTLGTTSFGPASAVVVTVGLSDPDDVGLA